MKWLLFTAICFVITPYAFYWADLQRGYDATGSEIFIPLIPFLMYGIVKHIKEMNKRDYQMSK